MLFKQATLDRIAAGDVTVAFRKWKRPTVRAGGTLKTRIGVLAIDAVDAVSEAEITQKDARAAGFSSQADVIAELSRRDGGELFRVRFRVAGADPRLELREERIRKKSDAQELIDRLHSWDTRSKTGPWTTRYLQMIAEDPGRRAPDLAESIGLETRPFKARVRKLKELGLTISLDVGYRLSPRGESLLRYLD